MVDKYILKVITKSEPLMVDSLELRCRIRYIYGAGYGRSFEVLNNPDLHCCWMNLHNSLKC